MVNVPIVPRAPGAVLLAAVLLSSPLPEERSMNGRHIRSLTVITLSLALLAGPAAPAAAQAKPEGEMRFAIYVTISPTWFDPGEVTGFITPFWLMWAMHDALVKTMPGKAMAPSLAESWTVSADQKTYDFKLRRRSEVPQR